MAMIKKYAFPAVLLLLVFTACRSRHKINQQSDEIYSRHLQRQVKLTIINTPMPDDKTELNLLILNDGQDMEKLGVKETLDSLYKKG
ncbi:MAG: hypothetical protein IPG38_15040 [Chitinophagaceae bacterium]|nr:hypothetical protein [Chitinophagaceae bacterium]